MLKSGVYVVESEFSEIGRTELNIRGEEDSRCIAGVIPDKCWLAGTTRDASASLGGYIDKIYHEFKIEKFEEKAAFGRVFRYGRPIAEIGMSFQRDR